MPFRTVQEFGAESSQLGTRCSWQCTVISITSAMRWHVQMLPNHPSDHPALHSFVCPQPACGQPKCSDLCLNAGSNFTCLFSKAARCELTDSPEQPVLLLPGLSCTLGADIWDTMEQPDDVVACFYLLARGYQG